MRVIAGKVRSLPLKTPEGRHVRPTTDRTKETLFNILQPYISESLFLDLFSGSGAIGIEALSRGALKAVFVENKREAVKCIEENLTFTKLKDFAAVKSGDVLGVLRKLANSEVYDIVFMDPPYNMELEKDVLELLLSQNLVDKQTIIVVEADKSTDFSYLSTMGFDIWKQKEYKTNKHLFLRLL